MSARRLVDDLVVFGRYTTFAGETEYYSLPINVVDYDSFELTGWRGAMPHVDDELEVTVEESLDNVNWSARWTQKITQTEQTWTDDVDYPWMRFMVQGTVGGSTPTIATGYVVGRLMRRRV